MQFRALIRNFVEDSLRRKNGQNDIFSFNMYGRQIKFYLPYRHDGVEQNIILKKDFYESDELKAINTFTQGKVKAFIDAGANIGNHTLYFTKIMGASRGYCFEPQTDLYNILNMNLELNNVKQSISTFNVALGDKSSKAKMKKFVPTNRGGIEFEECKDGDIEVKPLDSFKFKEKIDLLKIDVEGFEYKVLVGAEKLITKDRPIIFIETSKETKRPVVKFFQKLNYKEVLIFGRNSLMIPETKEKLTSRYKQKANRGEDGN